jgi:hypothetical protein
MTGRCKVFILCPAGAVSGGPEALHQLAGALRARGVAAAMVYYPSGPQHAVPAPYWHYGVAVSPGVADDEAAVIVIPEVVTSLAWRFPRARKAIWWLSVDNYFKWQHLNPGPSVLERRADFVHLCQSHYARDFLDRRGVGPRLMLTDFLTTEVFRAGAAAGRVPAVAFNPKKAPETTQRLMASGGGRIWLPLEGLDKESLAEVLRQVRVYVDFGPHPGRDRIPREAALCGAVVVTGRRGAAAFAADVPIPERFRLDEAAADFDVSALGLIDELLRSDAAFLAASEQQAGYRRWIDGNRDAFMREVDGFVAAMGLLSGGSSPPNEAVDGAVGLVGAGARDIVSG